MPHRLRTYTVYEDGGSFSNDGFPIYRQRYAEWHKTEDVTTASSGQSFRSQKYIQSGGTINGGVDDFIYSNFASDLGTTDAMGSHLYVETMGNVSAATKTAARTSPNSADVDLPVFLFELRELPDLVRKFHGDAIRRAADANLRYQFGIRPLVDDILTMMDFNALVDKRMKTLIRMRDRGSLVRKMQLDSGSSTENGTVAVHSGYAANYNSQPYRKTSTEDVWGWIKWTCSPPSLPSDTSEMRALATKAALGLYIDFSTAWNLIPWSWLVDWFSNVGDVLTIQRNIIPAVPSHILIMRKTTTLLSIEGGDNGTTTLSPLLGTYTTKARDPASYSITAELPFLTGRQWSILGSLAAVRGR